MTLAVGTRLGPYEILAQIGAGGMGEVYRAADTRLARDVALKIIAPQWAKDRQVRMRFEREARAISSLSHPHVCMLHDIGEHGDLEYLVMEFVEGETLADRLLRAPLTLEEFLRYAAEIADALEAAHGRGIIHRDLKPLNVMITPRGSVKILDFGLAKLGESAVVRNDMTDVMTNVGTAIGTIRYMSPEQATGDPMIGTASDVFSFGVLLYEALTGRHPFEGSNRAEIMHAILKADPVRPSALRADTPAPIDALLLQMMAKNAAERPAAAAIRTALKAPMPAAASSQREPSLRAVRHVVGRSRERAALSALLAEDRGRVIVISGEAGLGKTTLAEECIASFSDSGGAAVAIGRCSERLAGSEAYLPLLEALAMVVKNDPTLGLSLKVLAPAWHRQVVSTPESSPEGAPSAAAGQERLKRELAAFFEAGSDARPFILFIDDIHWADASTVDLIGYLARRLETKRLFIVVTARPSDLQLQKHPFLQISRELQTHGRLDQLPLEFLTWEDVRSYLLLEFPENRFPDAFHRVVYEKTEGSPLFMVDLLRYLRDQNLIVQQSGVWVLSSDVAEVEREIPLSVRSMIDKKIDQLSDEERRTLTIGSVQGSEFDSAVLARALEIDAAEVEDILDRLDRVHELIQRVGEQEHPDGTPALSFRFVHVLYQNSLYGSLGPARKASLSAKVGNALLALVADKTAPIASQLALLFESARDFARATDFFLLAAQHAQRLFANHESILLARRGLEVVTRISQIAERDERLARLHELLGDVLALIGQHDEARHEYDASLQNVPDDALPRARLHRKRANVAVVQRDYPEAAASYDRAEEILEQMPADDRQHWHEWVELQLDRGWMFYWQADIAALDRLATRMQAHLPRATPLQRAKFFNNLVMTGFRRDRYAISQQTLELAQSALSEAQQAADPTLIRMAEFMVGFSRMWRNELEEAEKFLQVSLQKSERAGDVVLQSRCLTYLTIVARKRRLDDLVRQFAERSLAVAQAAGMVEYVAVAKANFAWLAWRRQDFDEVLLQAREAFDLARGLPMAGPNLWASCFPMMATLLELDRIAESIEPATVLLGPNQHALTEPLQVALRRSIDLWAAGERDGTRQELGHVCKLAQESLFL
ncbi:MAG TPA: protein kinase [Thermoanaerobaculia bacterium]|nr:protein kinase [Thermoanaerobaculia bacterium]